MASTDYIILPYIQTTSEGAYIDTGIVSASGVKTIISYMADSSNERNVVGAYSSVRDTMGYYGGYYWAQASNNANLFRATEGAFTKAMSVGKWYTVTTDRSTTAGSVEIDGTTYSNNWTAYSDNGNLYLFARNRSGTAQNFFVGKIRYFKAYDSAGTLTANMKAAKRKSDGVLGMYDSTRDAFYTTPSGSFSTVGYTENQLREAALMGSGNSFPVYTKANKIARNRLQGTQYLYAPNAKIITTNNYIYCQNYSLLKKAEELYLTGYLGCGFYNEPSTVYIGMNNALLNLKVLGSLQFDVDTIHIGGSTLTTINGPQQYTSMSSITQSIYLHYTDSDICNFSLTNLMPQGTSSKYVYAYTVYTDKTSLKTEALARANDYTTVTVYHLDGSAW